MATLLTDYPIYVLNNHEGSGFAENLMLPYPVDSNTKMGFTGFIGLEGSNDWARCEVLSVDEDGELDVYFDMHQEELLTDAQMFKEIDAQTV